MIILTRKYQELQFLAAIADHLCSKFLRITNIGKIFKKRDDFYLSWRQSLDFTKRFQALELEDKLGIWVFLEKQPKSFFAHLLQFTFFISKNHHKKNTKDCHMTKQNMSRQNKTTGLLNFLFNHVSLSGLLTKISWKREKCFFETSILVEPLFVFCMYFPKNP